MNEKSNVAEDETALALLLHDENRELCEGSYYEFFKQAWEVLEPYTPLKDNWHIKYLCDRLQKEIERIARGEPKTKDLVINLPPRSTKSYICSIMLPAWAWTRFPHLRFISTSHSSDLSIDHCKKSRDLIRSDFYQGYWGHVFRLMGDQNVKGNYENDKTGKRLATSVKSTITGWGADVIICDDVVSPKDMHSVAAIESGNKYYDNELYSRLNDQDVGLRVVVMQRLHEDDLTGHALKKYHGEVEHLCIPGELEGADVKPEALKKYYKSGLFFVTRFTRKTLDKFKRVGRKFYLGQILQRPSEKEGNTFRRKDFRRYEVLPKKFDRIEQSWDMNFKEGKKNSFVCGQTWGVYKKDRYLLYEYRDQVSFKVALRAMLAMDERFPETGKVFVEDAANGPAIISILEDKFGGRLIAVTPVGSKNARAEAVAYMVECGQVFIPSERICSWIEDWLDEICGFPNMTFNDRVDSMSQYLSQGGEQTAMDKYKELLKGF